MILGKMRAKHDNSLEKSIETSSGNVVYTLFQDSQPVEMNAYLGEPITLRFSGTISCIHCGRKIRKSYSQGYCYPCCRKLAQCDLCILKPETCHYHAGTCREPEWGEKHCMRDHFVYIANSSGLKVGLTRATQIPARWMDQGAIQAIPVYKTKTRYQAGLLEVTIGKAVSDKTNWRKMLKGEVEQLDMQAEAAELLNRTVDDIEALSKSLGENQIEPCYENRVYEFNYPVLTYPTKIKSLNFDKQPEVSGTLLGIKGQYLILDSGVLNIRKFTGYDVELYV